MLSITSISIFLLEVINEENHIFTDSDIEKMFDFFKENNFKINSMCEFILGYEKQNGE